MNIKILTGNQIKLLLIILMFIDHAVYIIGSDSKDVYYFAALISRVVAPGMIYFLVEGYHYTRNLKSYIWRMLIFAIISQFAYSYAFSYSFFPSFDELTKQTVNVIWGLFCGLLSMAVLCPKEREIRPWLKAIAFIVLCLMALPADFMMVAVVATPLMYRYYDNYFVKISILSILSFTINFVCYYSSGMIFIKSLLLGLSSMMVIVIFYLYSGERGRMKFMKWFFYCFYPAHLLLLGIIANNM